MTSSNAPSGYSSNGPTSSAGASGGESIAALLTSTCGTPHSSRDGVEPGLDRRAVGDVDPYARTPSGTPSGGHVEARDLHSALGEPRHVYLPELAEAAGDDDDASGDVEQRVAHPRFAFHTASQSSRTQPYAARAREDEPGERDDLVPRVRRDDRDADRGRGTPRR